MFTPFLSTRKDYGSKGFCFCQQIRVTTQKRFHFCQQKGVTAQKCLRDIGNFFCLTCLVAINQGQYQGVKVLRFVFLSLKRVWQARSCSESWRISNYQISDPTKTHFFFAWFSKNSRKDLWIRNFIACCLGRRDQWVYSIFKIVPLGAPRFLFKWFQSGMEFFLDGFITNNDHQFFQESCRRPILSGLFCFV